MMVALVLLLAGPAGASTPPLTQVRALQCGAADLRMTSRFLAGPRAPIAPTHQRLTRRVGANQVPISLERANSVALQDGRTTDRYVASWACVPSARQTNYVLLGYACSADPGSPHDCGGEKEWFRLLDQRGRLVDAGVPHDGVARDRLNARLGIAGAMTAGVSMTPVFK